MVTAALVVTVETARLGPRLKEVRAVLQVLEDKAQTVVTVAAVGMAVIPVTVAQVVASVALGDPVETEPYSALMAMMAMVATAETVAAAAVLGVRRAVEAVPV